MIIDEVLKKSKEERERASRLFKQKQNPDVTFLKNLIDDILKPQLQKVQTLPEYESNSKIKREEGLLVAQIETIRERISELEPIAAVNEDSVSSQVQEPPKEEVDVKSNENFTSPVETKAVLPAPVEEPKPVIQSSKPEFAPPANAHPDASKLPQEYLALLHTDAQTMIRTLEDKIKTRFEQGPTVWNTEETVVEIDNCYQTLYAAFRNPEKYQEAEYNQIKIKCESFRQTLIEREFSVKKQSTNCAYTTEGTITASVEFYINRAKTGDYDCAVAFFITNEAHRLSLETINQLIPLYYQAGCGILPNGKSETVYPAGQWLCRLMGEEIINRLKLNAKAWYADPYLFSVIESLQGQKVDSLDSYMSNQVEIFKSIYNNLRAAETGPDFIKSSLKSKPFCQEGMDAKASIQEIIKYASDKKDSRTATAWRLTLAYGDKFDKQNYALINELYNCSFEKSFFGISKVTDRTFFRSSSKQKVDISDDCIKQYIKDSSYRSNTRTAKIIAALPAALEEVPTGPAAHTL